MLFNSWITGASRWGGWILHHTLGMGITHPTAFATFIFFVCFFFSFLLPSWKIHLSLHAAFVSILSISPLLWRVCHTGGILVIPLDLYWVNIDIIIKALHSWGHTVDVIRSSQSWNIWVGALHYNTLTVLVNDDFNHLSSWIWRGKRDRCEPLLVYRWRSSLQCIGWYAKCQQPSLQTDTWWTLWRRK